MAIIGDNVSTNKALADLFGKPLTGCAVKKIFLINYETILSKINTPMGTLESLKLSSKLRKFTNLGPV